MAGKLKKKLTHEEILHLSQTIDLEKQDVDAQVYRPKVKYIATEQTTILTIMNGVVSALQQKGLHHRAEELRRLILGGAYDDPKDALDLMRSYARLEIVTEDGRKLALVE